MQPGYPGSGQDPYGQQPPYSDPYAQPQYPPQPQSPQPPPYQDPYGQPQPPAYQDPYAQPQPPQYQDPYAQPQPPAYQDPYGQPTSGNPYPTSGPTYPGAPQYPMAGYGAPMGMPPQQNNTLGLISMIAGIVSIPGACCAILGILAGAAALVLGILGMRKASAGQASNRGQALAGVICGSIGLVFSIVSAIAGAAVNLGNLSSS
jgi:hypothetical protein